MELLWLKIAKNEIRLWTSRYRNHRLLFFAIIAAIMGLYAFVLVPFILNRFRDPLYGFLSTFGPALPYFMYYVFSFVGLYILIWCLTQPLSYLAQDTGDLAGKLEVLLKTPIKPNDILFGKFIGRLPTYLIMLFALAPWFVNLFAIAVPLSIFSQIAIYLILFTLIVLSMWLGNLLAAFLESRVRKSEKSRDLGRALIFVIVIFTTIFMYILIYVMSVGFADPTSPLFGILQGFPSTWSAVVIINLFGFSNIGYLHVGICLVLLLVVTVTVLYLGYRGAGRFYSLEPVETGVERVGPEKKFYRVFRRIIPGDFGIQVVSQLKQFSRKMENFSRIGYSVGISIIVVIFNVIATPAGDYKLGVILMLSVYLYSVMNAMMLGTYVIVGSKDNLWIYKKAPSGVKKFVWSVYIVNLLYGFLIGIVLNIVIAIVFKLTVLDGILLILFSISLLLALMACAIGIAFIFPTFEERGGKIGLIMMSFNGIAWGIFIGAAFLSFGFESFLGIWTWIIIALLFAAPIGYLLMRLGIRKLSTLE